MSEQTRPPSEDLETLRKICGASECRDKGTYTVKAGCTNCDWAGSVELTRGHQFSNSIGCPGCGCSFTLMRKTLP